MSTVQVAGIAIAAVILIVLVISLVITRRKDSSPERTQRPEPRIEDTGSLFDEAPRDGLHMLGKRDVAAPPEEPRPAWSPAGAAAVAEEAAPVQSPLAAEPAEPFAEETTDEIPAVPPAEAFAETATPEAEAAAPIVQSAELLAQETQAEAPSPVAGQPAKDQTEETPATEAPPTEGAAEENAAVEEAPAADPRMVRLSDIIVTTNEQQVDLADPDVRRMLKDLMQDEIDLAAQYRELGQNIDAVLQLTEAQRICRALGMTSHARLIQEMINELQ
jgi:hypothetical protein